MERKYIKPTVGSTYSNRNGKEYICKDDYSGMKGDYTAQLERVNDGWTLTAHGIQQYDDGTIEWNYSTGGCWMP